MTGALTFCFLGKFLYFYSHLQTIFILLFFLSNSLDPDQDLHSVGPELVSNCLQTLSADNKVFR